MSDYVFPFEKLQVWQLSVDLAEFVLDLLDNFPFQMKSQPKSENDANKSIEN